MSSKRYGLVDKARDELVRRFLDRKSTEHTAPTPPPAAQSGSKWLNIRRPTAASIASRVTKGSWCANRGRPPRTGQSVLQVARRGGGATTLIDGRSYVNFSSYNYLAWPGIRASTSGHGRD